MQQEVGPVRWAGVQFSALLTIEPVAAQHRVSTGIGAVSSYATIDTLSALPRGVEVPWEDMTRDQREAVEELDARVVTVTDTGATATLTTPCQPSMLWSYSRSWRKVEAVASLAQYAPVTVVLSRHPRDPRPAIAAARRTGVGIVLSRRSEEWVPVVPAELRVRLSVGRTRFLEVLFGAWLRQNSVRLDADETEPRPQLL
jgi:hypothetical protein